MMTEAVFAQALVLTGALGERDRELLRLLCAAALSALTARLREGITADSCREDLIRGASLWALAEFRDSAGLGEVSEFKAGDLTVKQSSGTGGSAGGLRQQAEALLAPYLQDRFAFWEV